MSLPESPLTESKTALFGLLLIVVSLNLCCPDVNAQSSGPSLRGYLATHDPSTVIQCKDRYYMFYTGQGILSKSSADRVFWSPGPPVFENAPAWTTNAVPGFTGLFWAPDVLYFNSQYHLWYAVSTWGSQVSAIGLVTNPTLDPTDPAYRWTDQGPVIQSDNSSPYNTIDPSFTWDNSGNLWMAFGSYWNGIYIVQLNPATGLRIAPYSPTTQLAYNSSIEASYLYRRGGYYYLFADWGSCCSGVNSTYNMRMGRSTSVTGPYLDQNGVSMVNNGGSLFQQGTGKFTGPGHVGILSINGSQWLSYHYYDANAWAPQYDAYGAPDLALVPLSWTSDNWPVFSNNWSAQYKFQADARDDNGQYYGLLENGAAVQTDPVYGHVLNLNGTNQYVWLPPGVGYAQTFAAVVKWRGGAPWQRIFDFGFDTTKTVMLTPTSSDNVLRCDINPGGNLQTVQWTQPLPSNVWTHVAVTFNGTEGLLYVNGVPVATNASMNLLPLYVAPQTNHLGRSKFTADPYFNGQYASFRAYSRALSPQEIVEPIPGITKPADGSSYQPGGVINFGGNAMDFMAVPIPANQMTWQINYTQDGTTNIVLGPLSGVTGGTFLVPTNATGGGNYTIILTATDNSNRQSSVAATLFPANPPASWSSYYPLRADAKDVQGHYNGVLNGGASFVSDPVRGSVLSLDGLNQYVSFPPGLAAMQTFMAWVKWNGGADWQRIYDFGDDTNRYSVLTPSASTGKLRFNISIDSIPGEQIADAPSPLPTGLWTHVAVVITGASVFLYTNGALVASNLYANLVPANLNATNNYLGKSQWPPDPYFSGELSDVRIFSRPLASNEIIAPQITIAQPSQGATYHSGDTISFAGGANDFYDAAIPASSLEWTVNYIEAGVTNTVSGPLSGITNGTFAIPAAGASASNGFYQVILVATDSAGRGATNFVNIFPSSTAPPPGWASFYPFTAGAQDASNLYNGTLEGGASIQNTLARGNVLNLSGSGQYVSLPAGAGAAQTVSGWVKWEGGSEWERIFDFGQNDQDYFFLTPSDSSSLVQCSITTDMPVYNQMIESPSAFPVNQWTYVAVVMDGREGILYLNGQAVAVNNSVNLLPSDIGAAQCYLGKSHYSADPYFYGMMDSISLNSSPLSLAQLIAPLPVITLPTNGTLYSGGSLLTFAGSATDYSGNALPATSLTWSGEFYHDGLVSPAFGPVTGVAGGSYQIPTNGPDSTNVFYTVALSVTDTSGYTQSVTTEVLPETALVTLATVPNGLNVTFDGQPMTGTTSLVEVVGMDHVIGAPSPQSLGSTKYNFVLWSDGGAATHNISVPRTNSTLTASFVQPAITAAQAGNGFSLSWPQWATGLELYTTTNLSAAAWTLVSNAPASSNNLFTITVPMTNFMQFYRLQSP
ncbi:MAG: LamG-like jellyroll fold domain-containing protein [Verrucomicrobiota bacterium]|jgi:arabinan endo-1,5-alpha-L-arabinosidase